MKTIYKLVNRNYQKIYYFDIPRKKVETPIPPVITISREKGAGGRIIAQKLVDRLGKQWKIYHKDLVEEIAKEAHTKKEKVLNVDEKEIAYMDDIIESLAGTDYFSLNRYHQTLLRVIDKIGKKGFAIVVGRGANFLLNEALKVRITADKSQRIKWLMEYDKYSEKDAIITINSIDKQRAEFTKHLFHKDIYDPNNYDLTIKVGNDLSIDDAAELIYKLAKKKFKKQLS